MADIQERKRQREWIRAKRAAQRKGKAMNIQTLNVIELAALKRSGLAAKDLELLNAVENEVWRRINAKASVSSRTPVKWTAAPDGSVSGESEPLK